MSANFDTMALAVQGLAPNNVVLYDDKGMPSIMVKIPKMTYAELGMGASTAVHPAFIVNGQEVDEIYISKFINIVQDSRAYSLPGCDPKANITFDAARQACEAKGDGWHLMTRIERGLLIRWMQNNGKMPNGNNNYGKDAAESVYKAIPSMARDSNGKIQRTGTGTGPLTWFHDGTPGGIADLKGLVWEWNGGLRTVRGEVQVLTNNNAADLNNSQGVNSDHWKAIKASDGSLITPDGSGTTSGSVKMDWISNKLTYSTSITTQSDTSRNCTFANIVCDATISDAAKLLLQDLGLLMYASGELFANELCYFNNGADERVFCSGGAWSNSSRGAASFSGYSPRSYSYAAIGFRSAKVNLPAV